MGILAALRTGWPAATLLTVIVLGVASVGLAVEIALVYTLYACSNDPFLHMSTAQTVFLCNVTDSRTMTILSDYPELGPWYAYILFIIPLCLAWVAFICLLILYILWAKGDSYYFDD